MIRNEYLLRVSKDTKEELDNIYSLWQECFGDTDAYMKFYFDHIIPKNQVISFYKDKEMVSMLHLNPYELSVRGKHITANYIVGVATKSSYRKRGLMGELIKEAFHHMYQDKQSLTYLMPIAKGIYEPYDFSMVYVQESWNCEMLEVAKERKDSDRLEPVKKLQDSKKLEVNKELENSDLVLKIAEMDNKEYVDVMAINNENQMRIEEMMAIHNDLALFANVELRNHYNVYVSRNEEYYKILLDEVLCCGGGILILKQEDEILGYAAYMFDDTFHIVELISKENYREKLVEELSKVYTRGNKGKSDNINTFQGTIMMRIINFEAFIKNVTSSEAISFVIELEDNILEDNKGSYLLELDEDKCSVIRTDDKPHIRVNPKQLVDLFFDRMSREDMESIVLTEDKQDIIEKLEKINKYSRVFINDVV